MGSGNTLSPPLRSLINMCIKCVLSARPCAESRNISRAWPSPQGPLRGGLGPGNRVPWVLGAQDQPSVLRGGQLGGAAGDPAGEAPEQPR